MTILPYKAIWQVFCHMGSLMSLSPFVHVIPGQHGLCQCCRHLWCKPHPYDKYMYICMYMYTVYIHVHVHYCSTTVKLCIMLTIMGTLSSWQEDYLLLGCNVPNCCMHIIIMSRYTMSCTCTYNILCTVFVLIIRLTIVRYRGSLIRNTPTTISGLMGVFSHYGLLLALNRKVIQYCRT